METHAEKPTRYYVHGDANEKEPWTYYCAKCDVFEGREHFQDEQHIVARASRYSRSLKAWQAVAAERPARFRRPADAENLLRDDAAADQRAARARRSGFCLWLRKQRYRDDPIGDLARDCEEDRSFPVATTSRERLRQHLIEKRACAEALVALDEALEEFNARPRGRTTLSLALRFEVFKADGYRCRLCGGAPDDGKRLEIDHKIPVARGGTDARENLWTLCFECNRGKRTNEV